MGLCLITLLDIKLLYYLPSRIFTSHLLFAIKKCKYIQIVSVNTMVRNR